VKAIAEKILPLAFNRLYGAFWGRVIEENAHEAVERSIVRYLAAIA
jgi:hypothetical protein